jgi:hypothetical protein
LDGGINDELERIWNKQLGIIKVLFWNLSGGTQENIKKLSVGTAGVLADI